MSDRSGEARSSGKRRQAPREAKAANAQSRERKKRRRHRAGRAAGTRGAPSSYEPPSEMLARALQLLEAATRARVREVSPSKATGKRAMRRLQLQLDFELGAGTKPTDLRDELLRQIDTAVESFRSEHEVLRQGVVPCVRHAGDATCDCLHQPQPRQVLAGFTPSGMPRFVDFAQHLLDSGHPEIDRLYREREAPLVLVSSAEQLERDLLEAFAAPREFVLHGQVCAGWYRLPNGDRCAPTFLLVSTHGAGRPWQVQIIEIGTSSAGGDLDAEFGGAAPWREALTWARGALGDVERSVARERRRAPQRATRQVDEQVRSRSEERLRGILEGLARRLERRERSVRRRTRHAEERRQEDRPTGMALPDLESAPDERVLRDARRNTLIVLGDRGRVHVFNRQAKLVTSIRFTQPAIERRLARGTWKAASPAVARDLRQRAPRAQREDQQRGAAEAKAQ